MHKALAGGEVEESCIFRGSAFLEDMSISSKVEVAHREQHDPGTPQGDGSLRTLFFHKCIRSHVQHVFIGPCHTRVCTYSTPQCEGARATWALWLPTAHVWLSRLAVCLSNCTHRLVECWPVVAVRYMCWCTEHFCFVKPVSEFGRLSLLSCVEPLSSKLSLPQHMSAGARCKMACFAVGASLAMKLSSLCHLPLSGHVGPQNAVVKATCSIHADTAVEASWLLQVSSVLDRMSRLLEAWRRMGCREHRLLGCLYSQQLLLEKSKGTVNPACAERLCVVLSLLPLMRVIWILEGSLL